MEVGFQHTRYHFFSLSDRDPKGTLIASVVASTSYVHSFAVTPRYIVLVSLIGLTLDKLSSVALSFWLMVTARPYFPLQHKWLALNMLGMKAFWIHSLSKTLNLHYFMSYRERANNILPLIAQTHALLSITLMRLRTTTAAFNSILSVTQMIPLHINWRPATFAIQSKWTHLILPNTRYVDSTWRMFKKRVCRSSPTILSPLLDLALVNEPHPSGRLSKTPLAGQNRLTLRAIAWLRAGLVQFQRQQRQLYSLSHWNSRKSMAQSSNMLTTLCGVLALHQLAIQIQKARCGTA